MQFSMSQLQTIAEKRFGYKPSRSTILSDLAAISIAIGVDYVVGEYNKKLYYWTPLNEEAELYWECRALATGKFYKR